MPIVLETRSWWAFILRGVLTLLLGIIALLRPEMAVFTLALIFGAYAVVAGVLDALAGVREKVPETTRSWGLFASGVASVLAGLMALFIPGLTATRLLYLIATWALATGILEIVAAAHLRKEIQGEWLLVACGIATVVFGAFLAAFPRAGALAMLFWIGAFALLLGVLLVALGAELRRVGRMGAPEPERSH